MCCGTKAGSHVRLVDSCITQLKVQGPSRTCNESKEEVTLAAAISGGLHIASFEASYRGTSAAAISGGLHIASFEEEWLGRGSGYLISGLWITIWWFRV